MNVLRWCLTVSLIFCVMDCANGFSLKKIWDKIPDPDKIACWIGSRIEFSGLDSYCSQYTNLTIIGTPETSTSGMFIEPNPSNITIPPCGLNIFNVTSTSAGFEKERTFLYFYYRRDLRIPDSNNTCMCLEGFSDSMNERFDVQFYDDGCSLSEGVCPSPDLSLTCDCNPSNCTCGESNHRHSQISSIQKEGNIRENASDTCTIPLSDLNLGTYMTRDTRTCYPTSGYGHFYDGQTYNCTFWMFCICNQDGDNKICDCDSDAAEGGGKSVRESDKSARSEEFRDTYSTQCIISNMSKESAEYSPESNAGKLSPDTYVS
ncbi:uncharacterized protein [Amphiura filiformis]|uniref:uncharacterized protein n=1 Tax=Amphiura filiformis TaxID=82378 RepID=UPI003B213C72